MSGENFMLNWVEHEKSFMTSGPAFEFIFDHTNTSTEHDLPYIEVYLVKATIF